MAKRKSATATDTDERPLSKAQSTYIEKQYYATLLEKISALDMKDVNAWIDSVTSDILASDIFSDVRAASSPSGDEQATLDASGQLLLPPSHWIQFIKKKFHNLKNRKDAMDMARAHKRGTSDADDADDGAQQSLSYFLRSKFGGRKLYEKENGTLIETAIKKRMAASGAGHIACYQPCLSELWDALGDDERADYEQRAHDLVNDVDGNLAGLSDFLLAEFTKLCHNPMLGGRVEATVFLAARDTKGALNTWEVQAHGAGNIKNFSEHNPVLWKELVKGFQDWANEAIPAPRPVAKETEFERNEDGVPIFPRLDLEATLPLVTRSLVAEYLTELYTHSHPNETAIPWGKLQYTLGNAHVVLQDPQSMAKLNDVNELAQVLMDLAKAGKVLGLFTRRGSEASDDESTDDEAENGPGPSKKKKSVGGSKKDGEKDGEKGGEKGDEEQKKKSAEGSKKGGEKGGKSGDEEDGAKKKKSTAGGEKGGKGGDEEDGAKDDEEDVVNSDEKDGEKGGRKAPKGQKQGTNGAKRGRSTGGKQRGGKVGGGRVVDTGGDGGAGGPGDNEGADDGASNGDDADDAGAGKARRGRPAKTQENRKGAGKKRSVHDVDQEPEENGPSKRPRREPKPRTDFNASVAIPSLPKGERRKKWAYFDLNGNEVPSSDD
ncbi:hypothetical protein R3P38DRAFT_3168439 [Favolaschia claudopus]|uniref:Uncharacterized protein n=1 Tax=Favolaschia claudopus TaxID=2862362 RepID=A0AAW0E595_9AGAR